MSFKKGTASFYKDLKFSIDAETRFLDKYGKGLIQLDGRAADFSIKGSNLTLELKCDRYDHGKYDNFIFERYSSGKKDGGVHRAYRDKCRYFVYWFINQDILYIFETVRLLARVKKMIKKHNLKLFQVENIGYTTQYYKMKREWFKDLELEKDTLNERKLKNNKK